ncbi:hypothetical protein P7C73_g2109, partial [Tremellales sp. Uapishka_1]
MKHPAPQPPQLVYGDASSTTMAHPAPPYPAYSHAHSYAVPRSAQMDHYAPAFEHPYPPHHPPPLDMDGASGSSDDEKDAEDDVLGRDGASRSDSNDSKSDGILNAVDSQNGPKKKQRITLARGGACVACRTCKKANLECRYEEIQRKKPRAVMLEERVAELEGLLAMRSHDGSSVELIGAAGSTSHSSFSPTTLAFSLSPPVRRHLSDVSSHGMELDLSAHALPLPRVTTVLPPPTVSLHSHETLQQPTASINTFAAEILPNSPLESALIDLVLPYTPFLLMPLHAERFRALLRLPVTDSRRPHPALLYILFAEAVRILEKDTPLPTTPPPPASLFPNQTYSSPSLPSFSANVDRAYLLQHVQGSSLGLLERARSELDQGIRNVDRMFDLVRAAIGIARYLYSLGRFIEGWNIPMARLLVSCGLHRQTGLIVPPDGNHDGSVDLVPKHYATQYPHSQPTAPVVPGQSTFPVLRMRPVILPPPRDSIELAERVQTFWAAKVQDWEAGIGWGWSTSLPDRETTTEWGWGWGPAEVKPLKHPITQFTIQDLHDPSSLLHSVPEPDTTYVLAIKSLALLHRSSALFDLPESSRPCSPHRPTHIPPVEEIRRVETALNVFRSRIPAVFAETNSRSPAAEEEYEGKADPWWIVLHLNLYAAEMLMWKEMANHQSGAYETAVSCARALVLFVKAIKPENWALVDMIAALDISLASRFLFKEATRLEGINSPQGAKMAFEDAEVLQNVLANDYSEWLPMASLHGLIVQRVREGWPEKDGEYERV